MTGTYGYCGGSDAKFLAEGFLKKKKKDSRLFDEKYYKVEWVPNK